MEGEAVLAGAAREVRYPLSGLVQLLGGVFTTHIAEYQVLLA
jgi:hypothetical protein